MNGRRVPVYLLMLLMSAGTLGVADTYTWTDGAAGNHDWDDEDNWDCTACIGLPLYPNLSNDDAIVPVDEGDGWDIDLITETIDDLTILHSVDFAPLSGTVTLTVDSVTITGGQSSDTVCTLSGTATIETPAS